MTQPGGIPILTVGRFYCDLIFSGAPRLPSLGTEVIAKDIGIHPGGGAFITAAHLSALGCASSLATMLPRAPFADLLRDEIGAARLDLSLCGHLSDGDGPQVTVAMVQGGDRAFLTRRAGPAFPTLSAQDLKGFKHLHIGELVSLVAQPEIVKTARSLGMTVSLDCSWDDDLRSDSLRPLLGLVDVFLPNEMEFNALRQMGVAEDFAPLTVIKRGATGAMARANGETVSAPARPVHAIDTTGAGDAFNAGFLAAWLGGASLADSLTAGNDRGALSVRQRGGFSAEAPAAANFG